MVFIWHTIMSGSHSGSAQAEMALCEPLTMNGASGVLKALSRNRQIGQHHFDIPITVAKFYDIEPSEGKTIVG